MRDGFARACRWAARTLRANGDPRPGNAAKTLRSLAARLTAARAALDGTAPGRERRRHEGAVERLERKVESARKAVRSPPLQSATILAGLAVKPHEVRALATLAALVGTVPTMLAAASIPFGGVPVLVLPALLVLPLLGYVAVLGHPDALARRIRRASLGETPEAINYLAMSLAVRPSLERAVAFAADHSEAAFGRRLRRVLWDVHLRTRTTVEDAFLALADEWGAWNEELKRAVYVIVHAVREGSRDSMPRALDRARAIAYDGARRRLQDYAGRLRGPSTALFALGVLLPLIVGSMLPLLSLGGMAPGALEFANPPPGDPLPWILLLDVAFPSITFLFAHLVSSSRPGLAVGTSGRRRSRRPFVILTLASLAALGPLALPSALAPVLAVGGILGIVSLVLALITRDAHRERTRTQDLEGEFPDALFQLGSRLGEGRGLEDAFLAVADGLRGTVAGELFGRIARSLRIGGGTVEEALFGARGALREVRSRMVRANLKMVVEIAAKDPRIAGRATLEMSDHLRDLQGVERDLQSEIRPTVDAMRATATFFAPVVLGVTGALYALLSEAFGGIASLPMPPPLFHVTLAVYLALATAAILHFATRIETGGDLAAFGHSLARALPVGYATFVATLALAGVAL